MELQTFSKGYEKLRPMGEAEESLERAERDLVERARGGDAGAFQELMDSHLSRVWRVVWRILRHREDTEDVVQEVFLAAHGALETFRGEARFSTWLHRIAVNRALNHRSLAAEKMRRASDSIDGAAEEGSADPAALLPSDGPSPLQELEVKELRRRLAECIEKLPSVWRAVLALRDGESLSYEEIGQRMGIALGTVRSRLARARLALRRCVQGETT
jgi:RNA polymerase sigma-70 factor (ECF subfamily)